MTAGTELCSSCGAAVQEGDHFCSDCGSPTVAPAVPAQYPQSAHRYQGPEVAYAPLQPLRPYAPQTTNGLAIASMVLGILWISGLGSILALIFGFISKKQIDRSGGHQTGRGMAVAGIVLGFIGIVGVIFWIVVLVAVTDQHVNTYNNIYNTTTTF